MRKEFHHPDLPRVVRPRDQNGREWMIEPEIDPDAPARPRGERVRVERLDQSRQQLEGKDRPGAELRSALKPGFAFGVAVAAGHLFPACR